MLGLSRIETRDAPRGEYVDKIHYSIDTDINEEAVSGTSSFTKKSRFKMP